MLVLALCYYLLPDVKQRFKYITPAPLEPPLKTPGAAKSASSAMRSKLARFRWRRRVARGQEPEPTVEEQDPRSSTLH